MDNRNVYAPPTSNVELPSVDGEMAGRASRFWGAMIDGVIGMTITFPTMYVTGYWEKAMAQKIEFTDTVLLGLFGLVTFAIIHGYFLANHGQTIGKRLVGTKIVSVDTNEILPFWKVFFVRYLPISVTAQLPVIGSFLVLIDDLFIFRKNKRCIHDLIAGTKVVKVSSS